MQQQQKLQKLLKKQHKSPQQLKTILQSMKKNNLPLTDAIFQYAFLLLTKFKKHIVNQQPIYLEMFTQSGLQLKIPKSQSTQSAFKRLKKKFESTPFIKKLNAFYMGLTSSQNNAYVKGIYDSLLKQDLTDYQSRKRKMALSKFQNKNDQFLQNLNRYLQENPNDIQTWQQLGIIYLQNLNLHKAAFCYQQLLILNPRNDHYYTRLAEIYASLGGYQNLRIAKDYLCYVVGKDQRNYRALWCLNRTTKYLVAEYQKNDSGNIEQIRNLYKVSTQAIKLYYKQIKTISIENFKF